MLPLSLKAGGEGNRKRKEWEEALSNTKKFYSRPA